MLAHGIAVFEKLLRKCPVHHSYRASCRRVGISELPALNKLSSDSVKIAGAGSHPGSVVLTTSRLRRWLPHNIDSSAPVVALHRTIKRVRNTLHAGDCGKQIVQLAIKTIHLLRLVSGHLWINVQNVAVLRFESETLVLHVAQALRQQSGCAQKNQRNSCLY